MKKRILALAMCLMLCVGLLPAAASATGEKATVTLKNASTPKGTYNTLAEAFSAAEDYCTIKLLDDVQVASNETLTLDNNIGINLDLNGKTMTVAGTLSGSGNINVESTSSGTFNCTGTVSMNLGGWTRDTFNFTDCTINAFLGFDGGIINISGGEVTDSGSLFLNNNAETDLIITISDNAKIQNLEYAAVADNPYGTTHLYLEDGYFDVDPDTYNTGYMGYSYDQSAFVTYDVNMVEQYTDQTDWAANTTTYPWRIKGTPAAYTPHDTKQTGDQASVTDNSGASPVTKYCDTLPHAVKYAETLPSWNTTTVTLLDNVSVSANLAMNKSLKLDLNGKTLTLAASVTMGSNTYPEIMLFNGASTKAGFVVNGTANATIEIGNSTAELTLNTGGSIYAVQLPSIGGTVTVNGGAITNQLVVDSTAVNAVVDIKGGTVAMGNIKAGKLNISGGTITSSGEWDGVEASISGGTLNTVTQLCIGSNSSAELTVSGDAVIEGGAVTLFSGTAVITGGTIDAFQIEDGTATVTGGTFTTFEVWNSLGSPVITLSDTDNPLLIGSLYYYISDGTYASDVTVSGSPRIDSLTLNFMDPILSSNVGTLTFNGAYFKTNPSTANTDPDHFTLTFDPALETKGSQTDWAYSEYGWRVKAAAPTYSVTLTGGGNATRSGGDATQTGLSGAMTTVPYTAKSGYHFEPFATSTTNGVTVTRTSDTVVTVSGTPTADVSITVPGAVANTYAVTVDGGTASPTSAAAGATVTITANAPATGKVFDKWTTEDGITFADAANSSTTFTMPAKAVTVKATYKDAPANTFTVTFDAAGGSPVPAQQTVTSGAKAAKPADPAKDNCDFNGWYAPNAAAPFDFNTPITASITLTAKWTAKSSGGDTAPDLSGSTVSGATISYGIANLPANAKLIAARYDGGRLTAIQFVNSPAESGTLTMAGSGTGFKLFLLDATTFKPLCKAWIT